MATIVAAINNGASSIVISADHIDIDGLVSKLVSKDIYAQRFTATTIISMGNVTIADQGLNIGDSSFRFDSHLVSWQSATINGTTIHYLGY